MSVSLPFSAAMPLMGTAVSFAAVAESRRANRA